MTTAPLLCEQCRYEVCPVCRRRLPTRPLRTTTAVYDGQTATVHVHCADLVASHPELRLSSLAWLDEVYSVLWMRDGA